MKKKVLLLASLSTVVAATALAGGLILNNNSYQLESVKGSDKEFVFDATVGDQQFNGEDFMSVVERSVVTGISSNIETSVSLEEVGTQRQKSFGTNDSFVQTSGGLTRPEFQIEIGLNNITSVSVAYALYTNSEYTTAEQVGCAINVYDEEGHIDGNASVGSGNLDKEAVLTWTRDPAETRVATSVVIEVYVPDGFIHYTNPLFIRSITVNWSC